jgi:hypothetical protein
MKKIVVTVALVALSGAAMAEWVAVGGNSFGVSCGTDVFGGEIDGGCSTVEQGFTTLMIVIT